MHKRLAGLARHDLVIWMVTILIGAVAIALSMWYGAQHDPEQPADADFFIHGEADPQQPGEGVFFIHGKAVPRFIMTAQDGRPFDSSAELDGKIWVVAFIFTNCAGPCPIMTRHMAALQADLADVPGLYQVSITVDPDRDTPEALTDYAGLFNADTTANWSFLTGDYAQIQALARDTFYLSVENMTEVRATARKASPDPASDDPPPTDKKTDESPAEDSATTNGTSNHVGPIIHSTRLVLVGADGRIVDWFHGTDPEDVDRLGRTVRRLVAGDQGRTGGP